MNEDDIVAEAQRRNDQRRETRFDRRQTGWFWLLLSLVVAVVLGFLLYPMPLPQKLLLAMGGVCGLRPGHSYFAGSLQLPLEARDTGIYAGVSLTLGALLAKGRVTAARTGGGITNSVLGLMFFSMVFDGVNSTLIEVGAPHLYASTNVTRLITGLLSGITIGVVLTWLLGNAARPRPKTPSPALLATPGGLLSPLALSALVALLVMLEQAWSYYSIALLSVGGLLLLLTGAALLLLLQVLGLYGRLTTTRQLRVPSALACLVALSVLAGSAMLRWA